MESIKSDERIVSHEISEVGLRVDYSPLKDIIRGKLDDYVEQGKMTQIRREMIDRKLKKQTYAQFCGPLCHREMSILRQNEWLEVFKRYSGTDIGNTDTIYFTYSKKQQELTHISTRIVIGGVAYTFVVLFSFNDKSDLLVREEIGKGQYHEGDQKRQVVKLDKEIALQYIPYIRMEYAISKVDNFGSCITKHEVLYSLEELKIFKAKIQTANENAAKKQKQDKKNAKPNTKDMKLHLLLKQFGE